MQAKDRDRDKARRGRRVPNHTTATATAAVKTGPAYSNFGLIVPLRIPAQHLRYMERNSAVVCIVLFT